MGNEKEGYMMKIKHYLYNAFLIQSGDKKIAIDPGALFFYFFRLTTLIPKSEWEDVTHILVTHGDIDHYWYADMVAEISNAPIICNATMVQEIDGKPKLLGPRDKGVVFNTLVKKLHTVSVDETIEVDGISITGIKTTHGALTFRFGPFSKTLTPGPNERIGWGSIGFAIKVEGKSIINLGDTLLNKEAWKKLKSPDILMIPIGGKTVYNTMDEKEALEAIKIIKPKLVIPCHYNCPALFSQKYNHADEQWFKREVEKLGIHCQIMYSGDEIEVGVDEKDHSMS